MNLYWFVKNATTNEMNYLGKQEANCIGEPPCECEEIEDIVKILLRY